MWTGLGLKLGLQDERPATLHGCKLISYLAENILLLQAKDQTADAVLGNNRNIQCTQGEFVEEAQNMLVKWECIYINFCALNN